MSAAALSAWGPPVLSVVLAGGIGGFLKVLFDRRLTKAMAGKTAVEGDVAQSADHRAWAERADQRAQRAEERADAADQKVRELGARVDDLDDDLRRLRFDISTCPGGPGCPLRPVADAQTQG